MTKFNTLYQSIYQPTFKKMQTKYTLALILFVTTLIITAQSHSEKISELDAYIQKGVELWNPPGLAVTVVKDGEIIFKKGLVQTTK
jgi:CubicO group peptidase (beta-lactamase class C family)